MPYQNQDHDLKPPSWTLALFRSLCHSDYREEIEGDLIEKYQADVLSLGTATARRRFYFELLMLLRPNLVFNFGGLQMNPRNWFPLLLAVLQTAY